METLIIVPVVLIIIKLIDLSCEYSADKTLGHCHNLKTFISWKKTQREYNRRYK